MNRYSSTYHLFFGNLANRLRISIIASLKGGAKSVSELAGELKVEQSKLSHALSNLKRCNIVDAEAKGKSRIYSLNKKTIVPILKLIDKHARAFCRGKCKFCRIYQK